MNKREVRRLAHGITSGLLQGFLDVGGPEHWTANEADEARLREAVDEMAQREFELGGAVNRIAP